MIGQALIALGTVLGIVFLACLPGLIYAIHYERKGNQKDG